MENNQIQSIHKRYEKYSSDEERHEAKKSRMMNCYYKRRENMIAERQLNCISPKKGGRPRKYKTDEERLDAIKKSHREAQRRYVVRQNTISV